MNISKELKYRIMTFFIKLFHLKFSASQDNNFVNGGAEIWRLKDHPNAYFYGTMKEFEDFHIWRKR